MPECLKNFASKRIGKKVITVCKKIVQDQQGKFIWIKTYNWQEHYFQSREIGPCWSRTIFLHTVYCDVFTQTKIKNDSNVL